MKISERIAKSEAHLFLTKLYAKGWKKVSNEVIRGGNIVSLERETPRGKEHMTMRFMNNGWIVTS